MTENKVAQVLNNLYAADPQAIDTVVNLRTHCNADLLALIGKENTLMRILLEPGANFKEGPYAYDYKVGGLGVLNTVLQALGQEPVGYLTDNKMRYNCGFYSVSELDKILEDIRKEYEEPSPNDELN